MMVVILFDIIMVEIVMMIMVPMSGGEGGDDYGSHNKHGDVDGYR